MTLNEILIKSIITILTLTLLVGFVGFCIYNHFKEATVNEKINIIKELNNECEHQFVTFTKYNFWLDKMEIHQKCIKCGLEI